VLWSLELPPDVVEDSARADVSVVGDLLGPTLQVSTAQRACHLHVLNVLKSGRLNLLEHLWPVQASNGIALPFKLSAKLG